MAECTIYDKLRYIAETKDLIKSAIEAQDVEVLESATFRQYAEYITQIRKVSSVNGMQGDVIITAKDLGALTEIPSEYITETELNEKGYLTAVPDVYITEDELSSQLADKVSQNGLNEAIAGVRNDIPTNVSQLTNDSGYITLNEVPKVDLSGYALKSEIPDISVKQDKLTAGNGISITDNVISLDYEYDLFEVVPSLPTENISDNKVYLLLDSNGSEGNTYVEYLYVNGQWEELGKFKVNIDLSGYATEDWVNSQGFLKEHQDISNLATKQELATKQDVISDLDTIRSGAAKGATALQSVPSGYATEEWVNGQGFLKEHQDISNLATKEELATKQDVISDLDTIRSGSAKGATALQSVPEEYAKKTDIPDISTKQDVIPDLDSIRSGAALGATALQEVPSEYVTETELNNKGYLTSVPSGYATEEWVNSQGFLKEHQDISNLATKQELATKQDVISDLDSIRSGASKGATALQSVPNTYALKTDILSAKTDSRYTTYEVQNPVLSGKTILLQNEATDSRKYHTLGYDKISTTIGFGNLTKRVIMNSDGSVTSDFDDYTNIPIDFSNITDDGDVVIINYVGTYTYNSEDGTLSEGDAFNEYITYNKQTKMLKYSDNIPSFAFTNFSRSDNGENVFQNSTEYDCSKLPEGVHLIWNIYVSSGFFYTYTAETKGNLFVGETTVNANTSSMPDRKNEYFRYENDVKAYILTDKNTTFKTINGEQITGDGDITIDTNVDLSNYATKAELNSKQDVINDLETIRSGAAKGATALQSVPEEYAKKTDIPDISTKQDVIPDLEAIRSGAAKGETALQSVPNTYALKSEIPDISVKQDKLTAGNGISITDNVISLDYEYDLFEVVPSLPTENISDNKIYLVYQSDGDGNNLYIEYIYASGHWEELGKFKANVDLSGYATEEWVNSQGFLKEHQDISNLATKDELNAKQDTINDLDSIRSGAALGATALQSVPEEYAKKTDIPDISTKQDVIPDLDTIRSGAALGSTALQTVPSGYATEQWVSEQGFLKEHQNISNLATKEELNEKQDTINDLETIRSGAAKGATALQSVPSEYVTETELNNKGYLTSVPDTYALKSEIPDISVKQDTLVSGTNIKTINGESILGSGNITIEGGGNVDLTNYYTKTETNELVNPKLEQITLTQAEYDALSTKEDNVLYVISDAEDLKFKTINGQQITGEGNIEIEASADNVPTVQTTPNGTTSNYIYSTISYTNPQYSVISDISNFITYSTDKASIATYQRYWGQESANSHQNWSINAATTSQAGLMSASDKTKLDGIDLTPYATKTELATKQDTLVSGTNIKTVNGISLLGEGNITISGEGGADLSGYYTKAEIDAMIGGASTTITQINNLVG